jgi:hypothetical protein
MRSAFEVEVKVHNTKIIPNNVPTPVKRIPIKPAKWI